MSMYRSIINFFIICIFSLTNGFENYRLSRFVTPVHYTIKIQPDFDKAIFYGNSLIYLYTKSSLEEIVLHGQNLSISDLYINSKKAQVRYDDFDKISVSYENETIQPGLHYIFFNYTGIISEENGGFIKAPFDYSTENVYVYVTDLEPYNARKVFPCFDEPYFKAKFSMRLVAPKGYEAISNMPEINKFPTSKGTTHVFETSVKMSTYLVSFAFTKYSYYENKFEDQSKSWPVRVYTVNASKGINLYAAKCAEEALLFYSDYTNISYPLPKLDMIEYERNRSSATENWGLITFRTGLLSDINIYSQGQMQLVIYHELGHFWFGNMVTNDWWNDLWLQEGFAVYMSYKMLSTNKKTTVISQMQEYQYDSFLETECSKQTNSAVSYISNKENILDKFDDIVYNKGAVILLMLEDVIGEKNFTLSLRTYLKKFAYQTATSNDFISIVEEIVPDQPVRSFLEGFLYQNKFPILTVEERNDTFILRQKVCQNPAFSHSSNTWTIPVTYITDKDNLTNPKFAWFHSDMEELEIIESDIKWIVFNPTSTGLYRTELSESMWKNILENFEIMDKPVAKSVITNALSLFHFKMINCDIIINLLKEIKRDNTQLFENLNAYLMPNFLCTNDTSYKNATDIYFNFIEKKIGVSGLAYANNLCDNIGELKLDERMKNCATWVEKYLDETNDVNK